MRIVTVIAVLGIAGCLALAATSARADHIALYAGINDELCINTVAYAVPFSVYVVHALTPGARGSAWLIEHSSSATSLGSSCAGLGITGDPYSGVSLDYGECRTGTFVICVLNFISIAETPIPGCYHLRVMPFPNETSVGVVDCNSMPQTATGGWFSFDGYGKTPQDCDDCATAAESSTWGRVKSLYR